MFLYFHCPLQNILLITEWSFYSTNMIRELWWIFPVLWMKGKTPGSQGLTWSGSHLLPAALPKFIIFILLHSPGEWEWPPLPQAKISVPSPILPLPLCGLTFLLKLLPVLLFFTQQRPIFHTVLSLIIMCPMDAHRKQTILAPMCNQSTQCLPLSLLRITQNFNC